MYGCKRWQVESLAGIGAELKRVEWMGYELM
jgi:hypothetical protein